VLWVQGHAGLCNPTLLSQTKDYNFVVPAHPLKEHGEAWPFEKLNTYAQGVFLMDEGAVKVEYESFGVALTWNVHSIWQHLRHAWLGHEHFEVIDAPIHEFGCVKEGLADQHGRFWLFVLLEESHVIHENGNGTPTGILDHLAHPEEEPTISFELGLVFLILLLFLF